MAAVPPHPDVVVALPAYNEAAVLPHLLQRIAEAPEGPYRTVVVDDGSSDGTAEVAERSGAALPELRVVRHGANRGLAAALMTGWTAAVEGLPDDGAVVTMDADDTHDPAVIPLLLARLREGADVAIASRFQPGGGERGLSLARHVFSRAACMLLGATRPIPGVRDFTCGYRAYRAGMMRKALDTYGPTGFLTAPGFACSAEALLKLAALGARCAEAPLLLRYDMKKGQSKIKIGRTIAGYFYLLRHTPPLRRTR